MTSTQTHSSYIMSGFNKMNITITLGITNHLNLSWKIETTHAQIGAKLD
jgi:hypothetical protein